MRTNVFRKGNWKQLPIYLGKKYIVDVFVQNEEQFKICGALKIIKTEQCFPSLQGTVRGVKLVTSPGLLAYFHFHQFSADTWVKTHRVRLLTLLFPKHFETTALEYGLHFHFYITILQIQTFHQSSADLKPLKSLLG